MSTQITTYIFLTLLAVNSLIELRGDPHPAQSEQREGAR